jgi:WS/DGAT/MGAT family acyltransferase
MGQRLTDSDASFLYLESASGPMHISSVYVLDGELPFPDVLRHFEERIHLVPAYRRRLAQVPFNLAHPTWEDDPEFDLTNHVLHHPLPEGTGLQDGIDAAVTFNETILPRERPLWRFVLVTGVPGKTLVLQQTHHAMIDGVSGIELTMILYDFDAKGANRPPPPTEPWQPEPVPGAMERITQALRDNFEKARPSRALDMLMNAGEQQRHLAARAARVISHFITRPAITAPFNAGLVGPHRRVRYLKKPFGEIREIRRALGGTINDVVLAVLSEAVARYLDAHDENTESQYMRIMCPVSVRTEDQSGSLGNQVSAIFPMLPAWPMKARQRLNAVCTETDRIKADQEAQALALMTQSQSPIWPVAMAPTLRSHCAGGTAAPADPAQIRLAAAQHRLQFHLHERTRRAGAAVPLRSPGHRHHRPAGAHRQRRLQRDHPQLQQGAVLQLHLRSAPAAGSGNHRRRRGGGVSGALRRGPGALRVAEHRCSRIDQAYAITRNHPCPRKPWPTTTRSP